MQSSLSGRRLPLFGSTLVLTVALSAPLATLAQADSAAADGTGVARMSLVQGNVSLERGDSSNSLAAVLNAPVLGGDYVITGDASEAEIQFDGAAQLRLGQDAQVRFTHLDVGDRAVQLAQGTLELRLLQNTDGSSEIDTPSISIKPQERGAYRVTVTSDGQTYVTVRSGEATIETPQGAQNLQYGTTLVAQGSASDPSVQNVAAVAPDDFDAFNAERDRLRARAIADNAFVNSDIGGVEDLDANGRWVSDGSYGHVWVPASVGPNWAPYRDGRWVWEDGYGWTWIAAEPWGWAPYHYGSWYRSPDYGWCWYPPQPRIYAPWRPALVAFFGFGAGAGFSLGFGGGPGFDNIGWVPLAPHESYRPWWSNRYGYDGNPTIVNNVTNITNVTNVTNVANINVYRNVRQNGVSGVTSQRFLQGNFAHNTPVTPTELRRAQVFRGALPIVPTVSNLRFTSDSRRTPVTAHPALVGRSFAGQTGVVRRTSFADQRVALASITHAPITPINFRDARTTPLVPQHHNAIAPVGVPPGGANAFRPNARKAPDLRANPNPQGGAAPLAAPVVPKYAHPSRGAAASDPWTRFNQSRAIGSEHRRTPGTVPAGSIDRKPLPMTIERQPASINTDHRPALGTYHPPAPGVLRNQPGPTGGYHQPAASGTDRQPSVRNADRIAPAGGTYHLPAANSPTRVNAGPVNREPPSSPRVPQAGHLPTHVTEPHAASEPPKSTVPHATENPHPGHPPANDRG